MEKINNSNIIFLGTSVGILEHSLTLIPKNILDFKQAIHIPKLSYHVIKDRYKQKGILSFTRGIVPMLSGVSMAHISLFYCLEKSKQIKNDTISSAFGIIGRLSHDLFIIPGDTIRQRCNLYELNTRESIRSLYKQNGMKTFFQGLGPGLIINIPSGFIDFLVLKKCNDYFGNDGFKPFLWGGLAGITSSILTAPFDTIKTLYQLKGSTFYDLNLKNKTYKEILIETHKKRGITGFFRGVYLRTLSSMLTYGLYEYLSNKNIHIDH